MGERTLRRGRPRKARVTFKKGEYTLNTTYLPDLEGDWGVSEVTVLGNKKLPESLEKPEELLSEVNGFVKSLRGDQINDFRNLLIVDPPKGASNFESKYTYQLRFSRDFWVNSVRGVNSEEPLRESGVISRVLEFPHEPELKEVLEKISVEASEREMKSEHGNLIDLRHLAYNYHIGNQSEKTYYWINADLAFSYNYTSKNFGDVYCRGSVPIEYYVEPEEELAEVEYYTNATAKKDKEAAQESGVAAAPENEKEAMTTPEAGTLESSESDPNGTGYNNHNEVAKDINDKSREEAVPDEAIEESEETHETGEDQPYVETEESETADENTSQPEAPAVDTLGDYSPINFPSHTPSENASTSGNASALHGTLNPQYGNPKINVYSLLEGKVPTEKGPVGVELDSKKFPQTYNFVDAVEKDVKFLYKTIIDTFKSSEKLKLKKKKEDPSAKLEENCGDDIKKDLKARLGNRFGPADSDLVEGVDTTYDAVANYVNKDYFSKSRKELHGKRMATVARAVFKTVIDNLSNNTYVYIGRTKDGKYDGPIREEDADTFGSWIKGADKNSSEEYRAGPKEVLKKRKSYGKDVLSGAALTIGDKKKRKFSRYHVSVIGPDYKVHEAKSLEVKNIYEGLDGNSKNIQYLERAVGGVVKLVGYPGAMGRYRHFEDEFKGLGGKRSGYAISTAGGAGAGVSASLFLLASAILPFGIVGATIGAGVYGLKRRHDKKKRARKALENYRAHY